MSSWWGAGITMTGKTSRFPIPGAAVPTQQAKFAFNQAQKKQLAALLVIEEQITALEKVLPVVHAWITNPAPMQDVLDELQGFSNALDGAQRAMSRVLSPLPGIKATLEIQSRLEQAHYLIELRNYQSILNSIENAVKVLEPIQKTAAAAINALPRTQRRSNQASPRAIEFIDSALIRSWALVKIPVHHGEFDPTLESPQCGHTPLYPHVPSSADNSAFREICRVCYQVITGKQDADPERAIKTFIKQQRARDDSQRRELGITANPSSGTAASKKPKLVSVTKKGEIFTL